MANQRANLIKCIGLQTFVNELDATPGSLRKANNINVDEKGVITPRRGFNDYGGLTGGTVNSNNIVSQIMEYKDSIIRQYQSNLEYEDSNGDFQAINGSYDPIREGFRTKYKESNSNFYFTTDEGIKKISVKNKSNLNADMVSNAGGIKAGYAEGKVIPTTGGFLPAESKVAYRVLFGTKDNNNNLIYGSPSSRFVVTNFSADIQNFEQSEVEIVDATSIVNGDHYILYTGTAKYTIYYDTDGSAEEPKTGLTIGSTYIKIPTGGSTSNDTVAAITANEIAANISNLDVSVSTSIVTITHTEEGNVQDITGAFAADGTTDISARIDTDTTAQGSTTSGSSATVEITGVVPNGITTDYFYQVYRTGTISVTDGLTINDIDPGDEANLVYESGLTQDEIDNGEFVFTDTTPDSFRASGAPLYTNEITGEGILQANEVPPISLDLELFKNYMFYANTKRSHTQEFTIVSVDNLLSGKTKFIIGNDDILRQYLFVGTAEVTDVTIDAIPSDGDYINLYSANDERQYYVYFGTDPVVAGAIGYGIKISDLGPTDQDIVATRISEALVDNVDFDISVLGSVLTFTHTNNGYTTGITNGVGSDITISAPSTDGTGELAGQEYGGDVLLSGLVSVGQAIDETARSLVKIISQDSLSPVNAYYLSTGDELPGNILLENRSLEDKPFYISVDSGYDLYDNLTVYNTGDYVRYEGLDYVARTSTTGNTPSGDTSSNAFWTYSPVGDEFTPTLPKSLAIDEFTGNNTFTTITVTDHGFTTNDEVFIGYYKDPDNPADPDSFSGLYTVTVVDPDTFTITEPIADTVVSFVPAYSATYYADVISDNEVKPNRLYYSKFRQPEAVPSVNFIDVGPQDEEIKRILALRDELYILKEDGIYVLSGTVAPFNVRLIDSTQIIAPDSAVVLNNQIYCLTEQGVTRISGSNAAIISRGIENLIDEFTNQGFDFSSNTFGVAYENDRAYLMFAPSNSTDTTSTQVFRFNIFEQTWTTWTYNATCGQVMSRDNKLYLGNGDRNYISQERKDNTRTDHSDRNFTNAINTGGVVGEIVELSSLADVEVGDVIVQQQDVTITYINNRILKKMDLFDTGITPPVGSTMFDSFKASTGDNLASIMQSINDYLVTLDAVNISAKSFTLNNIRTETELLISELNDPATITNKKNYLDPDTVYYEAYIESIDSLRNQVTIHIERPFVEGNIEIYKGYSCDIEWNPQHFGDPSALKQISYVTIMFDQNNFYNATASFYSDNAQAPTRVDFQGKGIGYWGDMPWSDPNHYWGGVGNDIPFRNPVPRGKQKCRYLSLGFLHKNAREYFRIVGISAEIRAISGRAYR